MSSSLPLSVGSACYEPLVQEVQQPLMSAIVVDEADEEKTDKDIVMETPPAEAAETASVYTCVAGSASSGQHAARVLQRSLTMYPADGEAGSLPAPRLAPALPPWDSSAPLPWLMPPTSADVAPSEDLRGPRTWEDAVPRDVDEGLSTSARQHDCQPADAALSEHDPLRQFPAASINSDFCLARIVKEGVVRQCKHSRLKPGCDLCGNHAKRGNKVKARYGKVTEDVPPSVLSELQGKLAD